LGKERILRNLTHYALFSHTRRRFKEKERRKHKGVLRYKEKKKKLKEERRKEEKAHPLNSYSLSSA